MSRVVSHKRFIDWEDRPITEITKQDVRDLLGGMIAEGKDVTANKTLVVIRQISEWAFDHDKIETVPTDRIKPPGAVTVRDRDRVFNSAEMVRIWNSVHGEGGRDSRIHGYIVRMLMLTGQRRGEVAEIQWSEIDFEKRLWKLPAHRSKKTPSSRPVVCVGNKDSNAM